MIVNLFCYYVCCRLVEKINRSVGQDRDSRVQIGVLDIYGFECFKRNRSSNVTKCSFSFTLSFHIIILLMMYTYFYWSSLFIVYFHVGLSNIGKLLDGFKSLICTELCCTLIYHL